MMMIYYPCAVIVWGTKTHYKGNKNKMKKVHPPKITAVVVAACFTSISSPSILNSTDDVVFVGLTFWISFTFHGPIAKYLLLLQSCRFDRLQIKSRFVFVFFCYAGDADLRDEQGMNRG